MPDIHFHPVYAWNLIDDLYESGAIQEPSHFGRSELGRGRSEGWIRPELKQRARMFAVYADSVVVPALVDGVDWRSLHSDGHLKERSDIVDVQVKYQARYQPDGIATIVDKLLLSHGEQQIAEADLFALLSWWRELREFEAQIEKRFQPRVWELIENTGIRDTLAKGQSLDGANWEWLPEKYRTSIVPALRDDPLKKAAQFKNLEKLVEREHLTISDAAQLAQAGVPTLANRRSDPPSKAHYGSNAEAATAIVTLYFENVRVPAPESARDALKMRENPSIQEWRKQISLWGKELENGRINAREIKAQIEDANRYIEGSQFLTKSLSIFSPTVSVAGTLLAGLATMAGAPTLAAAIGTGLFAVEGLKMYGEFVQKSVESPDRLQHKWLMLSPE